MTAPTIILPETEAHKQTMLEQPKVPREALESWYYRSADQRLEELLARVAVADVPVLLHGETGAGKTIFARRLHTLSPRAAKPLVTFHCGALIPAPLQPGAERSSWSGVFDAAAGGTMVLEEIGDLNLCAQAQLSQLLPDCEAGMAGSHRPARFDTRVIATARCDLERAVCEGRFLAGLYYRLNVVSIRVPSLRERRNEIQALAEFLLRKYAPETAPLLSPALLRVLRQHDWPGNVRELENVMRLLLVLRDPDLLARELSLSRFTREAWTHQAAGPGQAHPPLERVNAVARQMEAETILAALNAAHWNRRRAAAELRMEYKALLYKMKKLRLDRHAPANPAAAPQLARPLGPMPERFGAPAQFAAVQHKR